MYLGLVGSRVLEVGVKSLLGALEEIWVDLLMVDGSEV